MFVYEKKLQYPVKIKNPNPRLAAAIISQYGGPDGELGASLRYLSQRYSMPYPELKGLLTDIGTEELGHLEMVGTIVHQLTRNLTEEQIRGLFCRPHDRRFPAVRLGLPVVGEHHAGHGRHHRGPDGGPGGGTEGARDV